MATKNNRDVKLSLSVETLGTEGVKTLRDTIAQLAKEGGDAAPEFQRLADEIDRLGDQAKAVQSFEQIAQTVRELGTAQEQAAAKSSELKAALDTASASTQKAATTQAELKAELVAAQRELESTKGQLTILRNSYDENGKRVANYKAELERLTRAKVEQSAVVSGYRAKLTEANKAVADAESAENKAQIAYNTSEKSLDGLTKKLQERRGEMANQSKAIEDMGLSTDDLAQSQGVLLKSLNDTGAAAENLKSELDAARAAEKALADENARAVAANAEKIKGINDEIKFRQQLAAQREAAAKQAAAAEQTVAAEAAAQLKKQQADEQAAFNDKISRINMELKYRQQLAAQRAAVENEANRKSVEAEKQSAKEREAAAKAASDAIANAFKTTGAKSAAELRQQIEAVKGAMQLLEKEAGLTGAELKTAMGAGNQQLKELERELRAATGAMTTADKAANLFKNSMGQIAAGNLIADAIGMIVEKVKDLGREFIASNVRAETMTRALNTIYKNSSVAAEQMTFLQQTANTAGVAVSKISGDFVKFAASMQTANIPMAESNALFKALMVASGTLGLSTEKVADALNALGQVASKGVVSMEELRGQLGDALPGALNMAAKGMGVTDAALVKMVESGNLAASTFIPAFTKGLSELNAANDTLSGSYARLQNATEAFFQTLGAAGALDVMKNSLSAVTTVAKGAYVVFAGFSDALMTVGRSTGILYGALRTLTNPIQDLDREGQLLIARMNALKASLFGSAEEADAAQAKYEAMSAKLGSAAEAAFGASRAIAALNAAVAERQKKLEEATQVEEKHAKAVDILAQSQANLAKMTGDATIAAQAEIDGISSVIAAKQRVLEANQAELKLAQEALAANELLIEQKGGAMTEAEIKARDALQKTIESRQAEIATINAEISSQRELALIRDLEKRKLEDNSGAVDLLRAAYESATQELELLTAAEKRGYDVSEQKRVATQNLRIAQALLNDAYSDAKAKLQSNLSLMKSETDLKIASMQATKAGYDASYQYYLLMGNEQAARQAKISSMQVEIEIIKAKAAAQIAEADATIAVVRAEQEELLSKNQLSPAKLAATEASIKAAEAKKIEANASLENVKVLQAEINSLYNGKKAIDDKAASVGAITERYVRYNGEMMKAADAVELINTKYQMSHQYTSRQIELLGQEIDKQNALLDLEEKRLALERRRKNVDKEGFSLNTAGQRINQSVPTDAYVFEQAKSAGLSDAAAAELVRRFMVNGSPIWDQGRAMQGEDWFAQVNKAISQAKMAAAGASGQAAGRAPQQTPATGSTSTAKTYNVNIGGKTVRTASDKDAQALIEALKNASLTS